MDLQCLCPDFWGYCHQAVSKKEQIDLRIVSILAVPLMIAGIVGFGLVKRVNVYESFATGAKSGLDSMFGIVSPLVGLMVAIYMLRESGAVDLLCKIFAPVTEPLGMPGEVLPLAFLRPVSGSGSIAIVNDIFERFGADSPQGRIASVMMGSTETTFYTVAVYFGAIGVKDLRHTVKSALVADITGMILAVIVTSWLLL